MNVKFENASFEVLDTEKYGNESFAVCNLDFLGTNPNSHGLKISEEVLRRDAPSILTKFVVAALDIFGSDATTHVDDEKIVGYFPENQTVKFVENKEGYLRANAQAVISRRYAKDFMRIFADAKDSRAVSVEMRVATEHGEGINDVVTALDIEAVTVLGRNVKPSSPTSNLSFVRFAEEANEFYNNNNNEVIEMPNDTLEEVIEMQDVDASVENADAPSLGDAATQQVELFAETAETPEEQDAELAEEVQPEEVPDDPKVEEGEQTDEAEEHVAMEESAEEEESEEEAEEESVEEESVDEELACGNKKFAELEAELAELREFKETAVSQLSELMSFMQKLSEAEVKMSAKKEQKKETHIKMGLVNFGLSTPESVWDRL